MPVHVGNTQVQKTKHTKNYKLNLLYQDAILIHSPKSLCKLMTVAILILITIQKG